MMLTTSRMGTLGKWTLFGAAGFVLISLMILSGAANIVVWWMTGAGWTRYWYTGVGLACEVWAALGLVIITSRFVRGEWARGSIAVLLWLPAVAFNAYTVHRFFESGNDTRARAAVVLQASRATTELEITDLEGRISAANVTRSIAAIDAERALTPPEQTSRLRRLAEERQRVIDVEALRVEISKKRETLNATAAATANTHGDRIDNNYLLAAMAIWIEAMKALALWVLRGRVRETVSAALTLQGAPRMTVSVGLQPAAAVIIPEPAVIETPASRPAPQLPKIAPPTPTVADPVIQFPDMSRARRFRQS